jgi:hypothetical protein
MRIQSEHSGKFRALQHEHAARQRCVRCAQGATQKAAVLVKTEPKFRLYESARNKITKTGA